MSGPLCEGGGGGGGGGGGTTPVATSITLSPSTVSFNALGAQQQINATVRDQSGSVISGASVLWATSSSGVATVSGGMVTAVGNGTATIEASSGDITNSVTVTVAQEPSAIVVTPDALNLLVGEAQILSASVQDRLGGPIAAAVVSWASDNPSVSIVSGGGLATAVTPGVAIATAEYQSLQGRAVINVGAPLVVTTSALPSGLVGGAFSATLESSGGQGATTWSVVSGALPPGLSLDPSGGTITGIPTTSGTSVFTVEAASGDQTATRALSITVSTSLIVTTAGLADGVVGVGYAQTLSAAGGDGVYAWTIASGSLPDGLSLNGVSGEISGTPTTKGSSTFVVSVESAGSSTTRQYTLEIVAPLSVETSSTPSGVVGSEYGPATLTATGGTGGYLWSLEAGSGPLPTGLSLSSSGVISGTPTAAGTFDFVVRVESGGEFANGSLSITIVDGVTITTSAIADGVTGAPYSQAFSAQGGDGAGTWSLVSGALPTGLSLDPNTGVVSGTPTVAGSNTFTLQITSGGESATKSFTLDVYDPLSVTTTSLPEATAAEAYPPQQLSAAGGDGSYAWSISAGSLPAGMTLSGSGVLSGIPVAEGTANFTVRVVSGQQIGEQALSIIVNPAVTFTLAANGVTVLCSNAAVGDTGDVGGVTYTKRDRAGLDALVAASNFAPLSTTCTSGITSLDGLFGSQPTFNEDISRWDVSSVNSLLFTFFGAAAFNQDIGSWNVGAVTDMNATFNGATTFNQNISSWDVSQVTDMRQMFSGASAFDQPIGNWNVGKVTNMNETFFGSTAFNQDLSGWNTSSVTNMADMFRDAAAFNQPVGTWNVASVTTMEGLFAGATAFNQPIGSWNVGSVKDMTCMFGLATAFNQDIGNWDVSQVSQMNCMFASAAAFDQDISGWDVGSASVMDFMFADAAAFDQDISGWDVGSASVMDFMFSGATVFNRDLSGWCVSNIASAPTDFDVNASAWTSARPVWGTCSPTSIVTSTLTADPASLPGNGLTTSTLTVQLKDPSGANLTASGGTLAFDVPSLGSIGAVTDNADGTYTATYTSGISPGVVTITANLDGGLKTLPSADIELTSSAALHYPMDGDATDVAGSNYDLSAAGSPTAASGRAGIVATAVAFDGVSDYFISGADNRLDTSAAGSISAWFRTTDDTGRILSYNSPGDGDTGAGLGLFLGQIQWQLKFAGATTPTTITTDRFDDGAWHHVVVRTDGVSAAEILVDGVLVATTFDNKGTAADGSEWFADVNNVGSFNHHLVLGANKDSGNPPGNMLNGDIDDVRVYDFALSDGEVDALCDVVAVCGT